MWIMGKHFNNRAVSAVIATLLLIAIAVAAAIIVYVFSIGLLGGLQTSGGQQVKQQLIMEAYSWPASGTGAGVITMTLRNVGPSAIQLTDAFINGQAASWTSGSGTACSTTTPLNVGSTCSMALTAPSSLTLAAGVSYVLKLVSVDGAVFSYSAVYGSSS